MLKMTNVIYFDLYPEVIFDDDLRIDRGGNMLDFIVLNNQTCFFPPKNAGSSYFICYETDCPN